MAGSPRPTRFLSFSGSGAWRSGQQTVRRGAYGSAVMYDDGKILYAGGWRTTNTAETIDLNVAQPVWKWTGNMANARRHLNLTLLPTGEVLATGGVGGTTFNDLSKPVRAAELWNPVNGQWTTLASSSIVRGYHATSLLLPDGRVLHAGSGDGAGAPNQLNAEIFSPPYLSRGARPVISSAHRGLLRQSVSGPDPAGWRHHPGEPDPPGRGHPRLRRKPAVPASVVHGGCERSDGHDPGLPEPHAPGALLLFILNGNDVPSVARIIRIS